jgi:hypothetical protein
VSEYGSAISEEDAQFKRCVQIEHDYHEASRHDQEEMVAELDQMTLTMEAVTLADQIRLHIRNERAVLDDDYDYGPDID